MGGGGGGGGRGPMCLGWVDLMELRTQSGKHSRPRSRSAGSSWRRR